MKLIDNMLINNQMLIINICVEEPPNKNKGRRVNHATDIIKSGFLLVCMCGSCWGFSAFHSTTAIFLKMLIMFSSPTF